MSQYRRCYQPGGNYFFTLVTHHRCPIFTDQANVEQLKIAINKVKKKHPFSLNAIVVLPDHLHCLWKLPENDHDFSTRWRLIKRYFSMEVNTPVNHRDEKAVWQKRFWEHAIRNENDWQAHMDYIHYNPVKHGLVASPRDWQHTSFHHYVERELYEDSWGASEPTSIKTMNNVE